MTINTIKNGNELTIVVEGRLDTNTAPELEAVINEYLENLTDLTLDCTRLNYISSAGLRVLLSAQVFMNMKEGKMNLTHVNDEIMEILDITGFNGVLTIE